MNPYLHIENILTEEDIQFLRNACKEHFPRYRMPCYLLIDHLNAPTCTKIKRELESRLGEELYYLNDFYIFTDTSSKTNWHIDTELYTFERAVNAWILLSPEHIEDPLMFIDQAPISYGDSYHRLTVDQDRCLFANYSTGESLEQPTSAIQAKELHTPTIRVGDILAFDPKQFHKTGANAPKHAIALKFVMKGKQGFLSRNQVDPGLWPEVDTFNGLIAQSPTWENVIDGIRKKLANENDRKTLSAGFYPELFELYGRMIETL